MLQSNKRSFLIFGLIICAVLSQTYGYAQSLTGNQAPPKELKVSVTSEGAPLGYAYVFINGHIFGSADSTGAAYVPKSKLKTGDTLSVSFVGTESEFVVYDKELAGKQTVTLDLISKTHIDEVVVVAKDRSKQLFRKYVDPKFIFWWFTQYDMDYKIAINNADEKTGSFMYADLTKEYMEKTGERNLIAKPDTTLQHAKTAYFIYRVAMWCAGVRKSFTYNENMIIRYKGKDNGKHVFLIIRPILNNDKDFESNQTLIFADERSKEIVAAQSDIVYNNGEKISLSASYKPCGKGAMLYTDKVSGTITKKGESDWEKIRVEIDNVSVKPYKQTKTSKSKQTAK